MREGRVKKIVPEVSHLSFNGPYVASLGVPVLYVTERAVFEMRADANGEARPTLVEIAPGMDLQRDVLDQCHPRGRGRRPAPDGCAPVPPRRDDALKLQSVD